MTIYFSVYVHDELIDEFKLSSWIMFSVVNIHSRIMTLTSSGHSSWGQWPVIPATILWFHIAIINDGIPYEKVRNYIPASSSLIRIPSQCSLNIASLERESAIGSLIPWQGKTLNRINKNKDICSVCRGST